TFGVSAQIEVVAHEVNKVVLTDKLPAAKQGMAVAARVILLNKLDFGGDVLQGGLVNRFVPRRNDQSNFVHPSAQHLLQDDAYGGLLLAIAIHQHLERKFVVIPSRRCN